MAASAKACRLGGDAPRAGAAHAAPHQRPRAGSPPATSTSPPRPTGRPARATCAAPRPAAGNCPARRSWPTPARPRAATPSPRPARSRACAAARAGPSAAQRPQRHRVFGDAEIQVRPHRRIRALVRQRAMRGAQQREIHRHRPRRTQRRHLALLQHAQQARLQGQRHVADLVQEQHAPMRLPQQPLATLAARAGEGPVFIAEEFGFDQAFRQRRAVHRHERPGGAGCAHASGARTLCPRRFRPAAEWRRRHPSGAQIDPARPAPPRPG